MREREGGRETGGERVWLEAESGMGNWCVSSGSKQEAEGRDTKAVSQFMICILQSLHLNASCATALHEGLFQFRFDLGSSFLAGSIRGPGF